MADHQYHLIEDIFVELIHSLVTREERGQMGNMYLQGDKRTGPVWVVRRRTVSTPDWCRCGGASPARRLPNEISEVILLVDDDYEASVC